jgi:hypothetical protein
MSCWYSASLISYVYIKQSYSIASDISGIFNSHKGAFRREM